MLAQRILKDCSIKLDPLAHLKAQEILINNGKPLALQHLTYPHVPQQMDKLSSYLWASIVHCLQAPLLAKTTPMGTPSLSFQLFWEKNVPPLQWEQLTGLSGEALFPSFCAVRTHFFLGSHLFCPKYLIILILGLDRKHLILLPLPYSQCLPRFMTIQPNRSLFRQKSCTNNSKPTPRKPSE